MRGGLRTQRDVDDGCRDQRVSSWFGDCNCVGMSRRIREPTERDAVTASKRMGYRGGRGRGIVAMRDVRDRIQRKGQHEGCECNSQPLRWSSGQVEDVHANRTADARPKPMTASRACKGL
jgi:hypothetical protein